ncbi:MAG: type II toxin-antitoxin system Phd/YefM family antitoxin [Solirubrobacterales bacterium]
MCYVDQVGIRELRQNLSVHLRRVKDGEALEVTEHGRPVAVLGPLPTDVGPRERLLASGKLRRARTRIDELAPPDPTLKLERALSDVLAEDRDDRS